MKYIKPEMNISMFDVQIVTQVSTADVNSGTFNLNATYTGLKNGSTVDVVMGYDN